MFSSQQLISYVFANPDDLFYENDLLKLDLQQHLWRSLHRDYARVYFLNSADGCSFTVHTYGVRAADPAREKNFGHWLLDQLCLPPQEAAAFVCPLDVFCRVLSQDAWIPVLEQIAAAPKRTGIFVLTASAYAEDSSALLLGSPVFDRLMETAVVESRCGNQPLYAAIQKKKAANYLCLNTFTRERIGSLLLHLCSADPGWFLAEQELEDLARYLTDRLQSGRPFPELLPPEDHPLYLTYTGLHQKLRCKPTWDRLVAASREYQPSRHACAGAALPILRAPQCYAGQCMRLRLPAWSRGKQDSNGLYPEDTLRDIQTLVCAPMNQPEAPEIIDAVQAFLKQLDTLDEGDIDTCSLLLDTMKFCTQWVSACGQDLSQRVREILEGLTVCIKSSIECFRAERKLQSIAGSPIYASVYQKMREDLDTKETRLRDSLVLLKGCMLELDISGYCDSSDLVQMMFERMHAVETQIDFTDFKEDNVIPYFHEYQT